MREDLTYLNILEAVRWIPTTDREINFFILYGFSFEKNSGLYFELRYCETIARQNYKLLDANTITDPELINTIKDTYQYLKLKYGT